MCLISLGWFGDDFIVLVLRFFNFGGLVGDGVWLMLCVFVVVGVISCCCFIVF